MKKFICIYIQIIYNNHLSYIYKLVKEKRKKKEGIFYYLLFIIANKKEILSLKHLI